MNVEDARRHAQETVARSGTSFGAGMRILSGGRRDAMYAIYAFCREVDDIADEPAPLAEKQAGLAQWREEIDRIYNGSPQKPTGVALLEFVNQFRLPKEEFFMMIEGMEMDAKGPVIAPSMDELLAYTRRVAGSVGLLSMPVFGAPDSQPSKDFALSLGDALQLTNILRDVEEDAEEGRLYLPRELLLKHDCPMTPQDIVIAEGLPKVRAELALMARANFAQARSAIQYLDWKLLRPALLMMGVYETYLDKMTARGWSNGQPKIKLSKLEKLLTVARWYLVPKLAK